MLLQTLWFALWFWLDVNLSLNQTFLTFLWYVRQTWMTQLILAISWWICYSNPWWKKDFLLHKTYLWKTLLILIYIFHNFIQCFTSFCSINHLLYFYAWFLMPFHLNGILSIKPSANVFAFPDFNIHHHKHRLTNSGGTDRPSKILL